MSRPAPADCSLLHLAGLRVAIGPQPILQCLDLDLPDRTLLVLLGPMGSGKTTLLRTLAGLNRAHPALRVSGVAELAGRALFDESGQIETVQAQVSYVMQHARFFTADIRENLASVLPDRGSLSRSDQDERIRSLLSGHGLPELCDQMSTEVVSLPLGVQRRLSIVMAIAREPALLLVDEPTASLPEDEAELVVDLLAGEAERRGVVLVTHNQRHARRAGGQTALLAEGVIQEISSTAQFFDAPRSAAARSFVRWGSYSSGPSPEPEDEPEGQIEGEAEPDTRSRPAGTPAPSAFFGPRGFFWVIPGALGGMPRPGIVGDLSQDVDGLLRLGVTVLATLEETRTVDPELLHSAGIHSLHFPIDDMDVPPLELAREFCRDLEDRIERGDVVALHCRAGLGRTGTLLACQLIWRGSSAAEAIHAVRQINPRCIQSQKQVDFLREFAAAPAPTDLTGHPQPRDQRREPGRG